MERLHDAHPIFITMRALARPIAPRAAPRARAPTSTRARAYRSDLATCPVGDPSLSVLTNVDMGSKKTAFMLAASRSVAETLKKPESYVAVVAQDGLDMVWGGSDDPCALCRVTSLGSINLENNRELSKDLCELLGEFGIPGTRIYITFEDVKRENMGYDSATFAG